MSTTPQPGTHAPIAEASDVPRSPSLTLPPDGRIEWSHLGVVPPHKEARRQRFLRGRRRVSEREEF